MMTSTIPPRPRMRDRLKSILPGKSRPNTPSPPVNAVTSSDASQKLPTIATKASSSTQVSHKPSLVASASSNSLPTSIQINSTVSALNSTVDAVPSAHTSDSVCKTTLQQPPLGGATTCSPAISSGSAANPAFLAAIQKHIDKLPEAEKQAFRQANATISPDSLLERIRTLDTLHVSKSSFRPHAEKIAKFLSLLDRLLGGISIAIQANPDISSIAVGGVKLIVDIAMGFTKFFGKLVDMFDRISDIIAPLERYAERYELSIVRDALTNVYGDVLDFYKASTALFLDRSGRSNSHATFDMFLHSQWRPFETEFGEIDSRMDHHRRVLLEAAQAELLLAEGKNKQQEERKYIETKQREERKYFRASISLQSSDLMQSKRGRISYAGCQHILSDKSRTILSGPSIKVQATGCCRQESSRNGRKQRLLGFCGAMASVSTSSLANDTHFTDHTLAGAGKSVLA
jgi:hypothetical protein